MNRIAEKAYGESSAASPAPEAAVESPTARDAVTHTPGPWRLHARSSSAVDGATGFVVASCGGYSNNQMHPQRLQDELEANAAFIVSACNAHDYLLATLRYAIECLDRDGTTSAAVVLNTEGRAAVAKAES